jgi:hypothetical protein
VVEVERRAGGGNERLLLEGVVHHHKRRAGGQPAVARRPGLAGARGRRPQSITTQRFTAERPPASTRTR